MSRQLLLVPSLSCPASCSYCFGPHDGGPTMGRETVEAMVRWQNSLDHHLSEESLDITFHGGEPLVAGVGFYRQALPALRKELAARRVRISIQSNLWLLTDELCETFREYGVSIAAPASALPGWLSTRWATSTIALLLNRCKPRPSGKPSKAGKIASRPSAAIASTWAIAGAAARTTPSPPTEAASIQHCETPTARHTGASSAT